MEVIALDTRIRRVLAALSSSLLSVDSDLTEERRSGTIDNVTMCSLDRADPRTYIED